MNFSLRYVKTESHFCLPKYTPFILTQNLYDLLFQYVIDPVHEKNLQEFIDRLEIYIRSKSSAPFSIPSEELTFLAEGLKELKILNWSEIPVAVFVVENSAETEISDVMAELQKHMTVAYQAEKNYLYIYPIQAVV